MNDSGSQLCLFSLPRLLPLPLNDPRAHEIIQTCSTGHRRTEKEKPSPPLGTRLPDLGHDPLDLRPELFLVAIIPHDDTRCRASPERPVCLFPNIDLARDSVAGVVLGQVCVAGSQSLHLDLGLGDGNDHDGAAQPLPITLKEKRNVEDDSPAALQIASEHGLVHLLADSGVYDLAEGGPVLLLLRIVAEDTPAEGGAV